MAMVISQPLCTIHFLQNARTDTIRTDGRADDMGGQWGVF